MRHSRRLTASKHNPSGFPARDTLASLGCSPSAFQMTLLHHNQLLVPLSAANQLPSPARTADRAWAITRHVDEYANRARIPPRRVKSDTTSKSSRPKIAKESGDSGNRPGNTG
jgi:hypothetical protein